jgi:predicted small metal-binding protein
MIPYAKRVEEIFEKASDHAKKVHQTSAIPKEWMIKDSLPSKRKTKPQGPKRSVEIEE